MSATERHRLQTIFEKYASTTRDNQKSMSYKDFFVDFLKLFPYRDYDEQTLQLLGCAVSRSRDGNISFDDFCAFEKLLKSPDVLYRLAFLLFDRDGSGQVTFENFKGIMSHTFALRKVPYNFDSEYLNNYFGNNKKKPISYAELSQLLYDFRREHAGQAFRKYDKNGTGRITTSEFRDIIVNMRSDILTPFMENNLGNLEEPQRHNSVSFGYFSAFCRLFTEMELVKKMTLASAANVHGLGDARHREITYEEFMHESLNHNIQITPMEADILFQLASLIRPNGRLAYADLEIIAPYAPNYWSPPVLKPLTKDGEEHKMSIGMHLLEHVYRFALGSVAGACGATAVYPIDLVKTRMQNQRSSGSYVGELMYKNSMDCFKKVVRFEGFLGLYRGLAPQLVGVAPEKAIKLTVNDAVRDFFKKKDGSISFGAEVLAGCCAGGSQVVFTNPLEIVKIRLQVAGEITTAKRPSALSVIKELGPRGLYKGAKACFLRDIPFSGIYFPFYAHLKKWFADENGVNTPFQMLCAATIAGVPAASLVTPADVIKTRLQVQARKGQTTYSGLTDCARKIWREEGGRAFWKGAGARVLRSSPQFGVTLLTYELLQRLFDVDFGSHANQVQLRLTPAEAEQRVLAGTLGTVQQVHDDHIGGYRFAIAAFTGLERRFGLLLPKYKDLQQAAVAK